MPIYKSPILLAPVKLYSEIADSFLEDCEIDIDLSNNELTIGEAVLDLATGCDFLAENGIILCEDCIILTEESDAVKEYNSRKSNNQPDAGRYNRRYAIDKKGRPHTTYLGNKYNRDPNVRANLKSSDPDKRKDANRKLKYEDERRAWVGSKADAYVKKHPNHKGSKSEIIDALSRRSRKDNSEFEAFKKEREKKLAGIRREYSDRVRSMSKASAYSNLMSKR